MQDVHAIEFPPGSSLELKLSNLTQEVMHSFKLASSIKWRANHEPASRRAGGKCMLQKYAYVHFRTEWPLLTLNPKP